MSSLTQTLPNGKQHGLINTVGNSVPDDGFKRFAEKDRPAMEKQRKEDEKIVKALYLNKKGGQERLEMPYCRWAGQPITSWVFIHNNVYSVPKGLIDQVSSRCPKKLSGLLDANGKVLEKDEFDEPEHRFVPTSF